MMNPRGGGYIPGGHGALGSVIKIDLPQIIIAGNDGVEKVITANDSTIVRKLRGEAKLSDVTPKDTIIVIGKPGDKGEIEARLIRIMPAMSASGSPLGTSTPRFR